MGLFNGTWADGDSGRVLFGEESGIAEPGDSDALGTKVFPDTAQLKPAAGLIRT